MSVSYSPLMYAIVPPDTPGIKSAIPTRSPKRSDFMLIETLCFLNTCVFSK